MSSGDLEGALRLVEQAHALSPAPEILNNVGFILQEMGRYREAYAIYERVLRDPATDGELAAMDRARMAGLTHKIDRAWVAVEGVTEPLLFDGQARDLRLEVPLDPRVHVLELGGPIVTVLWHRFPIGEKTVLTPADLAVERPAAILLDGEVESLRIDGYAVANVSAQRVIVEAGRHVIAARLRGRGDVEVEQTLAPGDAVSIAAAFAPILHAALPEVESGPPIAPIVTLAAGAAAAIAGGGLLVAAEVDRASIRDADRNDEGLIVGLTYAEADRRNDRARDESIAGTAVLSTGIAVSAAAVLWWWLSAD